MGVRHLDVIICLQFFKIVFKPDFHILKFVLLAKANNLISERKFFLFVIPDIHQKVCTKRICRGVNFGRM